MEKNQKNTIFVSVITSFITTFMGSALNLSIPAMEEIFKVGAQSIGWVITVYMLTCAALAVPFGRIADLIEKRKILWIGILIFCISSALAIFSKKLWVLLVFRFFQGTGASMIFSTNIAILVGVFDEEQRGKVLGYTTCATYVGLSIGPVLGGILNYHFGWKSIFLVTAGLSLIAFCGAFFMLEKKENILEEKKMDIAGSISFVGSIVMLMYGLSSLNTKSFGSYILVGGILFFVLFIIIEIKTKYPIVKISMFKNNLSFSLSNLAALLNYGATFSITYLLSIYLQVVKNFTSQEAGLILISSTIVMAVLSPVFGKLSDQYSPCLMSSAGMGLCAVSVGILAFLPMECKLIFLIGILLLSGVGFALFSSPNTNAVMACVQKEDYGIASSILATMRSIGHTTSMSIMTIIIGIYMGNQSLNEASPQTLMQTMHTCFIVFMVLCILGIFMAMKRKM